MGKHTHVESAVKHWHPKSLNEIMAELTKPGKIIIQMNGWKNICQTLEYIFTHCCDLLDNLSGLAFEMDGLCQVVGYTYAAEKLKKKVLLGMTLKLTSALFKIDNEIYAEILEGFDELDRNLKKLSIWGCNFVILQVKLSDKVPFGPRKVPFDNAEYFGIFTGTAQELGMVPIIQFEFDLLEKTEEECASAFINELSRVVQSFFNFEVNISCLLISPLVNYSLGMIKDQVRQKAETLINSLKIALPPAIGGVVVASQGSYKALGLEIDKLSKTISRIPWPISCCYHWKVPTDFTSDKKNEVLDKWVNKQRVIVKVLSLASQGNLFKWKAPLTMDLSPDFITTHDYYDKEYVKAMLTNLW